MTDIDEFKAKTRSVFHDLHVKQGDDPKIFNRLKSLLSTQYLEVADDFFVGKTCLDAGCGSNANAVASMLSQGAHHVIGMDLDNSIMIAAQKNLHEFEGRFELRAGDVHHIPFPDGTFDFTHCSGVLHHSSDIFKGLVELARVTKPGGTLYIMVYGIGGIMRVCTTVLRQRYQTEPAFTQLIDALTASEIRAWIRSGFALMKSHGDNWCEGVTAADIDMLFDDDLVLTIKDRIQAPVYLECSEEDLVLSLEQQGFREVKRISRYPKLENIRRILSPYYFDYASPLARILYGSGCIQLKATKGL